MTILNGKLAADNICEGLKLRVEKLKAKGIYPELMIVTSGDSDAGLIYVRNKIRQCKEIGIYPIVKHIDYLTVQDVHECCAENKPIIFQMPMNGEVCLEDLTAHMSNPLCDVDGFVAERNVAALASGGRPCHYPCTPKGIVRLLDLYDIETSGMNVCVIGRSNIVGRPLARMFEQRGATVTVCHSSTRREDLIDTVKAADIVVSAVGKRDILTTEDFCGCDGSLLENKVFVDVGINRDENGKLCGDFERDLLEQCKAYTPVPGGVGPMTVAMLMENVVEFYEGGSNV